MQATPATQPQFSPDRRRAHQRRKAALRTLLRRLQHHNQAPYCATAFNLRPLWSFILSDDGGPADFFRAAQMARVGVTTTVRARLLCGQGPRKCRIGAFCRLGSGAAAQGFLPRAACFPHKRLKPLKFRGLQIRRRGRQGIAGQTQARQCFPTQTVQVQRLRRSPSVRGHCPSMSGA